MNRTRFYATLLLLLPSLSVSFSSGAGHCKRGSLADQSSGMHGNVGSGSLSQGGLSVKIAGVALSSDMTLDITSGQTYKVILEGSTFKGFLLRLESLIEGHSVFDVLSSSSDDSKRNIRDDCATTVAAMTHKNSNDKNQIEFDLTFPHSDAHDNINLRLDVTVVTKNDNASNDWYYEKFDLLVSNPPAPTATPTSTPTSTPTISPAPTAKPSTTPTSTPTVSQEPTAKPSTTPTTPPTISLAPTATTSPTTSPEPTPTPNESKSSNIWTNATFNVLLQIVLLVTTLYYAYL